MARYENKTQTDTMEIPEDGIAVKYGEGKDAYDGFKMEGYFHEVGKRDKYTPFHMPEIMTKGIYNVIVIKDLVKGKLVARITYEKNAPATAEYLKQ